MQQQQNWLEQITAVIASLKLYYPGFTDAQVKAYPGMLNDIPLPVLKASVAKIVKTKTFPPTVAEIREEAVKVVRKAQHIQLASEQCQKEWLEVYRAIRRCPWNETPAFDNPITAQTVRTMGWPKLVMQTESDTEDNRKEFCTLWMQTAKEQRRRQIEGKKTKELPEKETMR